MALLYDNVPISGREGTVTAVIDGNVVELATIKTLVQRCSFNGEYNYACIFIRSGT